MFATVRSATLLGVQGSLITVEVHAARQSLPGFTIVGLPDEACRESRDRVRAAVLSSGLPWPSTRITVNLAPARQRKGGSGLDLAIAVGVLAAHGELPGEAVQGCAFLGELGLDGSLRPVPGVAPMVAAIMSATTPDDVVPVVATENHVEAAAVASAPVRSAHTLLEVVRALRGDAAWPDAEPARIATPLVALPDLADVRGQPVAKLALEVAAAGAHHLLLVGPPGSGKTMLAQRLPALLPPLDHATAVEATMVHSAAGVALPATGIVQRAPFRAPHHSSSMVALVGGGTAHLRPGELSLSHGGVLFLDEMGEFAPTVLDGLRQPLEDGVVRVARARASATLPARFLLVAATNPCPCGGGPPGSCACDDAARLRYLRRLSGPLLDRFDLRVGVDRPDVDDLLVVGNSPTSEASSTVAARVADARAVALARQGTLNAELPAAALDELAPLTSPARTLLRAELEGDRLTGRGYHRVRRVARTLADLDGAPGPVTEVHVALAMQMRVNLRGLRRTAAA